MKNNRRLLCVLALALVALPTGTSAHFKLQVIQLMADHAYNQPGGYSYHHCADLQISADPSKPIDKGWPTATPSQ